MGLSKALSGRLYTILIFTLFSALVLSFLFEGQVLHLLFDLHGINANSYVVLAILATFVGLFFSGAFIKTLANAQKLTTITFPIFIIALLPFFTTNLILWRLALIVLSFATGATLTAWAFLLRAFIPREERMKTCADVLILSNLVMILINVLATQVSVYLGLLAILICLILGVIISLTIELEFTEIEQGEQPKYKIFGELKTPLLTLCIFIAIITINSGLMYEVINPAFAHLTSLTMWYWAVPYIVALVVLRNLSGKIKHSHMLYAGIGMIIAAFISFMLLGRSAVDYLIVDTLMLAACGIFDLFWWSILAEMLDHAENAAAIFGLGLSANVFGVFIGCALGMSAHMLNLAGAEITVLALTVICITLVILPLLNRQLVLLLKNHAYLVLYDKLTETEQAVVVYKSEPLEALTIREQEVLTELLKGGTNREIAATLFISENTVKTHARNIFAKYAVRGRVELISRLLQEEIDS